MNSIDYLQIYNLETYLLDTVGPRFCNAGFLSAFDFFCIIIWKSNRAKSKIARRMLKIAKTRDLEVAVKDLTQSLFLQPNSRHRMQVLIIDWGFQLPMTSAILTILYPNEFTIYDFRVCQSLNGFEKLNTLTNFDLLWEGYQEYLQAVVRATPANLSLRDKDRYLWARSFTTQLERDIESSFNREIE